MQRSAAPGLFASYHEVQSGPVNGVSWPRRIKSLLKISLGTLQASRLVRRYRPAALLITGGWATFPVALACRLFGVPITIFLPDIEPGLAIRWIGRLAQVIYATVADSQAYFPAGKVVATGYPLRAQVLAATRTEAISHFGLDPKRRTLLVFGGSRGARSLNQALAALLPDLLGGKHDDLHLQILHVSGETDWPQVCARRDALPSEYQARYHVYSYLHDDMGLALAAADLAISRAGASTLGELPQFGLPAILVPLSFAWRYQKINADWLAQRGAAVRLDDDSLATELLPTLLGLLSNPDRLAEMRLCAAALAVPDGAQRVAHQLVALAEKQKH